MFTSNIKLGKWELKSNYHKRPLYYTQFNCSVDNKEKERKI